MAISAFAISIISLFVAIHHGNTMKEMAEANARMVEATVWPYVEYTSGNVGPNGTRTISMSLTNQGVGPARIEKFQILYQGRALKSTGDLMNACCVRDKKDLEILSDPKAGTVSQQIEGRILPAHSGDFLFLGLTRVEKNAEIWDRLDKARFEMHFDICFCSVFDECWISTKTGGKATKVKECPASWVSYVE